MKVSGRKDEQWQAAGGALAEVRERVSRHASTAAHHAFTLVEMLVVISILAILAALAVPAIKNLGKSNVNISATRQLLDDVGRARQLAIADHTTVYMVFVPTNFWLDPSFKNNSHLTQDDMAAATNLSDKQLMGYTFVSYGKVGDQPGQHQWHYLAPWKSLPEGSFVAERKFAAKGCTIVNSALGVTYSVSQFDYTTNVPFPLEDTTKADAPNSPYAALPYIAFNYLGQLTDDGVNIAGSHEYIPIARGTVLPAIDPTSKQLQLAPADVSESPPGNSTNTSFNLVDIDPLTGRPTLRFQHVQ